MLSVPGRLGLCLAWPGMGRQHRLATVTRQHSLVPRHRARCVVGWRWAQIVPRPRMISDRTERRPTDMCRTEQSLHDTQTLMESEATFTNFHRGEVIRIKISLSIFRFMRLQQRC